MKRQIKKKPFEATWDAPCIVMASGPSLGFDGYADVELVRQSGLKVIVVNSTHEIAPWADAIYAGDSMWWKANESKVPKHMERWACSKASASLFGCTYRARFIKPGYNSGANAIEVAANVYKANPVILLGFDMSVKFGTHHHGDHTKTTNPTPDRCARWKPQFKSLRERAEGTQIINCSRYSEIPYFPMRDLQEVLNECLS